MTVNMMHKTPDVFARQNHPKQVPSKENKSTRDLKFENYGLLTPGALSAVDTFLIKLTKSYQPLQHQKEEAWALMTTRARMTNRKVGVVNKTLSIFISSFSLVQFAKGGGENSDD